MVAICGLVLSFVAAVMRFLHVSVSGSVIPFRYAQRSAAAALDPRRHRQRVAIPGGRNVGLGHLLERLEDAEVIVLSFRSPERDHRAERREAGLRILELADHYSAFVAEGEALPHPAFHAGGGIGA